LTLEVADNGKGASDLDLAKAQSFGIRGLKERAKTVGGWLDVSSRFGAGLAITLTIPLTDAANPIQEHSPDDQSNFV
jgi:signal transduction histidine kinase